MFCILVTRSEVRLAQSSHYCDIINLDTSCWLEAVWRWRWRWLLLRTLLYKSSRCLHPVFIGSNTRPRGTGGREMRWFEPSSKKVSGVIYPRASLRLNLPGHWGTSGRMEQENPLNLLSSSLRTGVPYFLHQYFGKYTTAFKIYALFAVWQMQHYHWLTN